jgi:TPR repeat protein
MAGNAQAMFNLGSMLAFQWNPPDLIAARSWSEKAAEAGPAMTGRVGPTVGMVA